MKNIKYTYLYFRETEPKLEPCVKNSINLSYLQDSMKMDGKCLLQWQLYPDQVHAAKTICLHVCRHFFDDQGLLPIASQ